MTESSRSVNHGIVSCLIVTGTLLTAIGTFGRAMLADDDGARFNYVLTTVITVWAGFVLWIRHRRWVRSINGDSDGALKRSEDE